MDHVHIKRILPLPQSTVEVLAQIEHCLLASKFGHPHAEPERLKVAPSMNQGSLSQAQEAAHIMEVLGSEPTVPRLIPVRYRSQQYPPAIVAVMTEVPAHFDALVPTVAGPYSLHTEYASKVRTFKSPLLQDLKVLTASHRRGVPELWTSKAWALEFAEFIFRWVGTSRAPTILEVHPPFISSVTSFEQFLDIYTPFEVAILERYPACRIVMENRCGSKHPHSFLLSGFDSLLAFGQALGTRDLRLGVALDLPQLFTAAFGGRHLVGMEGVPIIEGLSSIRDQIQTLHLWGRGPGGGAHFGALDGLFDPTTAAKPACLAALRRVLGGGHNRFLVIEVGHGSNRLDSILQDLEQAGFLFDSLGDSALLEPIQESGDQDL